MRKKKLVFLYRVWYFDMIGRKKICDKFIYVFVSCFALLQKLFRYYTLYFKILHFYTIISCSIYKFIPFVGHYLILILKCPN